ncbi:MAG TPA: T9SS type A sorting domain-containing protein, partial [Bacteroidia bacterium]|nr:T9SS type A sorting domain-containing protein [Bacteroidia bacterium]
RSDTYTGWTFGGLLAYSALGANGTSYSAMFDTFDAGGTAGGTIQSPNIDLSGAPVSTACSATLSFYVNNNNGSGSEIGIYFSNNGGTTFTLQTMLAGSNTSGWVYQSIAIPSSYFVSTFQVKFLAAQTSSYFAYAGIDEVAVTLVPAGNTTWLTTGTSDWNTASNWSTALVPGSCTSVTIPAGGTQPIISASENAICNNLTINSGATLTFSGSLTHNLMLGGNLVNNGTLIGGGAGGAYLYYTGSAATASGTGTFTSCNFLVGNGANLSLGSFTSNTLTILKLAIYANGTLSIGGDTLVMNDSIVQYGKLNLNNGKYVDKIMAQVMTVSNINAGTGIFMWDISGITFSGSTSWNIDNPPGNWYTLEFRCPSGNQIGLALPTSTRLTCNGSFIIWDANTTVQDYYSFYGPYPIDVGGNWTNNGTFTPYGYLSAASHSSVTFNGSGIQYIGGTNSTSFEYVIINNTAPHTSGIYQAVNTSIGSTGALGMTNSTAGIFTLTQGVYNLNGYTLTSLSSSSTAFSAGSSNSYIQSENTSMNSIVKWTGAAATEASYVFPFGVNLSGTDYYIPFTFQVTTPGTGDVSLATYHTGTANTPLPPSVTSINGSVFNGPSCNPSSNGAVNLVVDRFWQITAAGSPIATLTFSYPGVENTTNSLCGTSLSPQRWSGSWWGDASTDGNVYGTGSAGITSGVGTVSASGISTFSPWTLVLHDSPLPVEFTNLTSSCTGSSVRVEWTTASETNNHYFTVERSKDGIAFTALATLAASGTTSGFHQYGYTDQEPEASTAYYRISQTDFNGNSMHSWAVARENCQNNPGMLVSSANGNLQVQLYSAAANNVQLSIYDALGRKIISESMGIPSGTSLYTYPLEGAAGIYMLVLQTADSKPQCRKIALVR